LTSLESAAQLGELRTNSHNEKILLKVTDGFGELIDRLETPVTLEEFEPEYQPTTDFSSWQIQFSSTSAHTEDKEELREVYLALMSIGEIYPNPVFAVYGLAHGVVLYSTRAGFRIEENNLESKLKGLQA
jgi:hypothetical protein